MKTSWQVSFKQGKGSTHFKIQGEEDIILFSMKERKGKRHHYDSTKYFLPY